MVERNLVEFAERIVAEAYIRFLEVSNNGKRY